MRLRASLNVGIGYAPRWGYISLECVSELAKSLAETDVSGMQADVKSLGSNNGSPKVLRRGIAEI